MKRCGTPYDRNVWCIRELGHEGPHGTIDSDGHLHEWLGGEPQPRRRAVARQCDWPYALGVRCYLPLGHSGEHAALDRRFLNLMKNPPPAPVVQWPNTAVAR